MDIDPHTLQLILSRIRQQMRCPQCGKQVPVDFASVRVVSESAMILQLKCDTCNAYIVLHASLQGVENVAGAPVEHGMRNASSSLHLSDDEVRVLHNALEQANGSFEHLFRTYGAPKASGTDIA